MKPASAKKSQLPAPFRRFGEKYPAVMRAYETLGQTVGQVGPLDEPTRELVKLALAIGAGLEGAVHSHTRRARAIGCSPEQIRHVALLATTTLGFPRMMAAWTWVEDVLGRH